MNIDKLTPQDREKYYQDVCKLVQLPPEPRLLDFIYMDSGDGARTLVLYALKGATDVLRNIHGISGTGLTKDVGDGYVAWIASGVNKDGRTEVAVGAASTKGLTGEGLARAVTVAQTRATRRLTLQFVGAGILDESEVNEKTTNISSVATLPTPIMPSVAPSSAPAQVIIPAKPEVLVLGPEASAVFVENLLNPPDPNSALKEAMSAFADIQQSQRSETRKPGPRRTAETQSPKKVEESRAHEAMAELETLPIGLFSPDPPFVVPQKPAPVVFAPLTKEEVNQKIFHYRTEVLEPAGLAPSSGMGVFAKIKAAMKKVTNTDDEKNLEKWGEFFRWVDEGVANAGAAAVVQTINKEIGATE